MKDSFKHQNYVCPSVKSLILSAEKMFVASASASHEDYEAVDLFE